ncbi:alpha/beta-hydrolase [Gautieria morchelliformis]|nr:alpha/beta-hydrolase [Gautieria morchelliformis]
MNALQKRAYASESEENFRWISFLLATKSHQILTSAHVADDALHAYISDIGEYAEVAHGSISPSFVFKNLDTLSQPGFPLEGYHGLKRDGPRLVTQFTGSVSGVQGYAAFRPHANQLVVAFSGTSSPAQTLKDIQAWRTRYPLDPKHSTVHSGFWSMYQGVRRPAYEALHTGIREHEGAIQEVVLTGHSMGSTMCYLLALDLMAVEDVGIPRGLTLTITTFGSPRLGNESFARYWRSSIDKYRSCFGHDSFREYSVKGYNDGAHTLPPCSLGFRHLTSSPLYFHLGRLYHVPPSEGEHGSFIVADQETQLHDVVWPKGGHNYYFRDMEKLQRRMRWLEINVDGEANCQNYLAKLSRWEDKWGSEKADVVS